MHSKEKKADIRRHLMLMRYPRRSEATFTDANDHNPLVLQECPECGGSGHAGEARTEQGIAVEVDDVCTACGGSGLTGEAEHYFLDDCPETEVMADTAGWLTCPRCRWRFSLHDRNAWTGRRHRRCGQKLRITDGAVG